MILQAVKWLKLYCCTMTSTPRDSVVILWLCQGELSKKTLVLPFPSSKASLLHCWTGCVLKESSPPCLFPADPPYETVRCSPGSFNPQKDLKKALQCRGGGWSEQRRGTSAIPLSSSLSPTLTNSHSRPLIDSHLRSLTHSQTLSFHGHFWPGREGGPASGDCSPALRLKTTLPRTPLTLSARPMALIPDQWLQHLPSLQRG